MPCTAYRPVTRSWLRRHTHLDKLSPIESEVIMNSNVNRWSYPS